MLTKLSADEMLDEMTELLLFFIRLSKVLSQEMDNFKEYQLSITPKQSNVLIFLLKYRSMSMTQLSDALFMTRQHTTQVVDALVKKGLIERKADPDNRRLVLVQLTEEGQSYMKDILYSQQGLITRFMDLLDEDNKEKIHQGSRMIKEAFRSVELPK